MPIIANFCIILLKTTIIRISDKPRTTCVRKKHMIHLNLKLNNLSKKYKVRKSFILELFEDGELEKWEEIWI